MILLRDGKQVAHVGLAMISVGPCMTCGEERSLMYAMWSDEPVPEGTPRYKAPTCYQCMHIGGMFAGIYANYVKEVVNNG